MCQWGKMGFEPQKAVSCDFAMNFKTIEFEIVSMKLQVPNPFWIDHRPSRQAPRVYSAMFGELAKRPAEAAEDNMGNPEIQWWNERWEQIIEIVDL